MFLIGKKGSTGVILGSIAIVLLLFVINSSLNITQQNEILLHMQAARETSLKTENAMWILDKAADKVILDNIVSSCNDKPSIQEANIEFASAMNKFEQKNSNTIICSVSEIGVSGSGNNIDITGTLICTTSIEGFSATDTRDFTFNKTTGGTFLSDCTVGNA